MHSYHGKGVEDANRQSTTDRSEFRGRHPNSSQQERPVIVSDRHAYGQQDRKHDNVSTHLSSDSRYFEARQSELAFHSPDLRERQTIFESVYPLYGNITGLPEPVRPRGDSGMPTVETPTLRWNQLEPKMSRARLHKDSEEEYFVDGNFFFNHLVRHKEAEDYNMAEMLRERSRELQRRNVLSSRFSQQNADRLSQSLPLEAHSTKRFYYANIIPEVQRTMTDEVVPQEVQFAGGLEIEIPPRRHAGIGGGGLARESMSADRLLMVTSSHRDSAFFGQHYFKMAKNSGSSQSQPSRIPSSYSAVNFAPKSSSFHTEKDINVEKSPATKDVQTNEVTSRVQNPGIEPTTNRYNVRTGRLEHSPDFAPKLPPKSYNRQDSYFISAPQQDSYRANPHTATKSDPHKSLSFNTGISNPTHLSNRSWDRDVSNVSQHPPSDQQQPKKFSSQSGNLSNIRQQSYTLSPQPNSTIVSRKMVTWQDHVSPPHLSTVRSTQSLQNPEDERETSVEDLTGISFPLSDSLARNFVIEELHDVDQFALFEVSNSKLAWGKGFMGSNWLDDTKQYKFVVLNRNEEVLFVGVEEESSLSDCISSPHKSSFSVRILDAGGREVVNFRRLYSMKSKTSFSSGSKTKYRLEVSTPEGHVIGNVEKTYDSDSYYILEDRTGEFMFLVQRSCICTCPLFWDYEYKILLPESGTEIGEISWSYLTALKEHFHGTEISFPIELNSISKVMLLGVCFLLNFSRWQSAYLDAIYNPWRRKENFRFCPCSSGINENKELAALLRSSPDVEGFHRNEEAVDTDIELETSHSPIQNEGTADRNQSRLE